MKILILTREREKRGLSKFALGRIANVHPATVGKIESGRPGPLRATAHPVGGGSRVEGRTPRAPGGGR